MYRFKKLKGIKLTYEVQGLIFFTCRTLDKQSIARQNKIKELCMNIAGADAKALLEVLTTDTSILRISEKHFVPEKKLYQLRKSFYEEFAQYL